MRTQLRLHLQISSNRFVLIIVALLCCFVAVGQDTGVLTVCEVLKRPPRQTNTVVEVRGEYKTGYHGHTLSAFECTVPDGLKIGDEGPAIVVLGDKDHAAVWIRGLREINQMEASGYRGRIVCVLRGKLVAARRPYFAGLAIREYLRIEFPDRPPPGR